MEKFAYHGVKKFLNIYLQIAGVIGVILFSSIGIFLWNGIFIPDSKTYTNPLDDPRYTFLCLGLAFVIGAWFLGSILLNAFPTVYVNENGLKISAFLFLKIFIPWDNIIDVDFGHPPKGCHLVRVRKITVFHRPIGWLYSSTLYPSFLIGPGMKDKEKLIVEIRKKIIKKPH